MALYLSGGFTKEISGKKGGLEALGTDILPLSPSILCRPTLFRVPFPRLLLLIHSSVIRCLCAPVFEHLGVYQGALQSPQLPSSSRLLSALFLLPTTRRTSSSKIVAYDSQYRNKTFSTKMPSFLRLLVSSPALWVIISSKCNLNTACQRYYW